MGVGVRPSSGVPLEGFHAGPRPGPPPFYLALMTSLLAAKPARGSHRGADGDRAASDRDRAFARPVCTVPLTWPGRVLLGAASKRLCEYRFMAPADSRTESAARAIWRAGCHAHPAGPRGCAGAGIAVPDQDASDGQHYDAATGDARGPRARGHNQDREISWLTATTPG